MILDDIKHLFHLGDRLSIREVKRMLQAVYDRNEVDTKAKSTDLALFGIKTKRSIIAKDGRRVEGIRIIKIS